MKTDIKNDNCEHEYKLDQDDPVNILVRFFAAIGFLAVLASFFLYRIPGFSILLGIIFCFFINLFFDHRSFQCTKCGENKLSTRTIFSFGFGIPIILSPFIPMLAVEITGISLSGGGGFLWGMVWICLLVPTIFVLSFVMLLLLAIFRRHISYTIILTCALLTSLFQFGIWCWLLNGGINIVFQLLEGNS